MNATQTRLSEGNNTNFFQESVAANFMMDSALDTIHFPDNIIHDVSEDRSVSALSEN